MFTIESYDLCFQDLQVPLDVTYEEIMNVEGESQPIIPRKDARMGGSRDVLAKPTVQSSSVSFVSSWAPQEKLQRDEVSVLLQTLFKACVLQSFPAVFIN